MVLKWWLHLDKRDSTATRELNKLSYRRQMCSIDNNWHKSYCFLRGNEELCHKNTAARIPTNLSLHIPVVCFWMDPFSKCWITIKKEPLRKQSHKDSLQLYVPLTFHQKIYIWASAWILGWGASSNDYWCSRLHHSRAPITWQTLERMAFVPSHDWTPHVKLPVSSSRRPYSSTGWLEPAVTLQKSDRTIRRRKWSQSRTTRRWFDVRRSQTWYLDEL